MAAIGGAAAVTQAVGQAFPQTPALSGPTTAAIVGLCVVWGARGSRPDVSVRQEFRRPDTSVVVEEGDLFDQQAHVVVGFCDTFDTLSAGGVVIDDVSVQGQLLHRRYGGDVRRLDDELGAALGAVAPVGREDRDGKPLGKLDRYPIGTVAVLGDRPRLVFASAYGRIGNDYLVRSSAEDLWHSLTRLWDAVQRHARMETVAIPLVGSGLSRLDHFDQESLLRLLLLSYVARSREGGVCRELRVVVRPGDLRKIDLAEVAAFLRVLASVPDGPRP